MRSYTGVRTVDHEVEPGFSPCRIRTIPSRKDSDSSGSEAGFTLVEMMLTCAILAVVLAITTPVVTAFYDVNNDVQQSFNATNQLVLASETLTQYLHEAVAPCPPSSTECSTTAFSSSSAPDATSFTFYANTGDSDGPVQVVITTSGTTVTGTVYNPMPGTCPFNGSLTTGCSYPTASHLLVSVPDLTNASDSSSSPMFTYDVTSGTNTCSATTPSWVAAPATPNVGQIAAVCINLEATLHGGQPAGYQTLAFPLAISYNGSVG